MSRTVGVAIVCLFVPFLLLAQSSDRQKLVDRLAKDLRSRDAATRAEAAESLGNTGYAEAIEPLVTALKDRDPMVREAAAGALWDASKVARPAIPALREALSDPSSGVVARAAGALIAMDESPKSMAEPLRTVLQQGDEVDRFLAARALIGIDPAGSLADPILDYLRRNAPDPRSNRDVSASHDNFVAGTKALQRLAATQDRTAIAPLMRRIHENPYLTEPILKALGEMRPRPDGWVETLLANLNSKDPDVRETAVDLLGEQKAPADVKLWATPVSQRVTDAQKNVRDEAIRSLKEVRGLAIGAIGPVLQAVRSDPDEEIRESAAEAVGEIADAAFAIDTAVKAAAAKEALPVLSGALDKDPSVDVRTKALKSIDKLELDSATVVDILARAAVSQPNRNLRLDALQALRNRGREAAPVKERIVPLKNDPDELVRRLADAAIEAMASDYVNRRTATTTAAVDPQARDKALETLREYHYAFTEEAYFSALNDVEPDIVTAFLDAGMSPNQKFANSYGNPVLRVVLEASEGCDPAVRPAADDAKALVKLLLARGADPNIADDRGNTPLMTAAERCDPAIVKMLLDAKADMNKKNITGMTAFEFGLWNATDGAAALAKAGFRLPPDKVKMYREAYAKEPAKLELLKLATKATTTSTPSKKK